jgi:ubiquinone/menaquinone biosynthesis C-methylase UbiE
MMKKARSTPTLPHTSWDPLASWYDGWMGAEGSLHHRKLAIPAALELLGLQPEEWVLDIGAGQGVLAPYVAAQHAHYTGVDASPRLLQLARKHHGQQGKFLLGNACQLHSVRELKAAAFDAVVFLLSIQDMDPLPSVLESAAWVLRGGGRVVMLMTHPCFRVPRQSGWGWQPERKLQFRRIDRYLTPLAVPMKSYAGQNKGTTISFHRPLQEYINGLARHGLLIEQMKEITTYKQAGDGPHGKAEHVANQEIPLFLGLRACKVIER